MDAGSSLVLWPAVGLGIGLTIAFYRSTRHVIGSLRAMIHELESRLVAEKGRVDSCLAELARVKAARERSPRQPVTPTALDPAWERRIEDLERLLAGCDRPSARTSEAVFPTRSKTVPSEEATLLAVVNRWRQSKAPMRRRLMEMCAEVELPAYWCALHDVEGNMQSIIWNGPYRFVPCDRDGGWLCVASSSSDELFVVPADPAFFRTSTIRSIVSRIFTGDPDAEMTATRACRIRQVADQRDLYVVVSKGEWSAQSPASAQPKESGRHSYSSR